MRVRILLPIALAALGCNSTPLVAADVPPADAAFDAAPDAPPDAPAVVDAGPPADLGQCEYDAAVEDVPAPR
ncbi:MAG: hypothetical protein JWM10_3126, partial [Myxococcaceae bacterium]|nr:hypothetical protein [Myxococcaceae bacterium]